MTRINVYSRSDSTDPEPPVLEGWFDPDAADAYAEAEEWDGNNMVSVVGGRYEHEQLYRTAGGRWVLNHWSQWEGRGETYHFVTDQEARDWLLRCNYDSADIERITGAEVAAERGPGQPQIGTQVKATISDEHLALIDAMVQRGEARTRSEAVRQLLARALA